MDEGALALRVLLVGVALAVFADFEGAVAEQQVEDSAELAVAEAGDVDVAVAVGIGVGVADMVEDTAPQKAV